MKNVLVISTSLRTNSNSEALADAFAAGARDAGNTVELVFRHSVGIIFKNFIAL